MVHGALRRRATFHSFAEAIENYSLKAPLRSFNPEALDQAARALPKLHSLLVSHRGTVVFERYYNGTRADRPANVKSAPKSVISALAGTVPNEIPGPAAARMPVRPWWPE